ncbi:MAG: flippase [Patescibacteria group bacterium]
MSLTGSIARQTVLQIAAKAISVVLGIVTVGALTRYLGQEGYGNYTTVISYIFFFAVFADFGLYLVTLSEIGRPDVDHTLLFSNAFTMRLCTSIAALLLGAALVTLFPYPAVVKQGVAIVCLSTLANLLDQMDMVILQKQLKLIWSAAAEVIGKIVILAGTLIVIQQKASLTYIFVMVVAGYAIHFLINFIGARRLLPFTLHFDFPEWKRIVRTSWPVALSGLFVIIYFKADTILLSILRPAATAQREVGIYGAPYKMLEVLITFPSLFLGMVMPHLSSAYTTADHIRFDRIFQKSFDLLTLITMPLIAGTLVLAEPLMAFIAGKDFLVSAPVLKILILATGIIYLTHLSVYGVIAIQQQKRMMPFYIIAAIGATSAYVLTIPRWSYFGTAWTTVAVELFIGLAATRLVWKKMHPRLNYTIAIKAVGASVLMAAVILLLPSNLFMGLIAGCIVYGAALLLTKGITKDQIIEIAQLRSSNPISPPRI